jgi:hypothetical protein
MEKQISERMAEIEETIGVVDEENNFLDEINTAQVKTINQAGTVGQYHFWVDLGGFTRGDATGDDIKSDCKLLDVEDENRLYSKLNDLFCANYKTGLETYKNY